MENRQEDGLPEDELPGKPSWSAQDRAWMEAALAEAQRAGDLDEVPIGAVLVSDGALVARGHNLTRSRCDPTAHAEIIALRHAARRTGYQRLDGAVLYTTVEPCFMCAGALIHARVARVVWGARDPKFGGCVSLGSILNLSAANHRVDWQEGLLTEQSKKLLQEFFRSKRGKKPAHDKDHRQTP